MTAAALSPSRAITTCRLPQDSPPIALQPKKALGCFFPSTPPFRHMSSSKFLAPLRVGLATGLMNPVRRSVVPFPRALPKQGLRSFTHSLLVGARKREDKPRVRRDALESTAESKPEPKLEAKSEGETDAASPSSAKPSETEAPLAESAPEAKPSSKPPADGFTTGLFGIKFKVLRDDKDGNLDKRREEFKKMVKKDGKNPSDPEVHFIDIQLLHLLLGGALILYLGYLATSSTSNTLEISFQKFRTDFLDKNLVAKLIVVNDSYAEVVLNQNGRAQTNGDVWFGIGSLETFERNLAEALSHIPESLRVPVVYSHKTNWSATVMNILPTGLLLVFMYFMFKNSMPTKGGMFGGGKSTARKYNPETDVKVKFEDVAGLGEAKEEVMEFVKFLKNPKKYEELGAKIPRGAILSGPPGTGKTLIAKATAGEAGVPFYSCSGSDFYQMFVGVGASKVRDLFKVARENAPCIVFVDEIDAIGKSRSAGGARGNDERESTLNQLLVEMDGFSASDHVVVLAGTNRADVLDSALMRPGRFDRHIHIDKPELEGRKEIFNVHLKKLLLAPDIDRDLSGRLSTLTPGFSGADIANVCNEAALTAARLEAAFVEVMHFELAIERVIGGVEKKSKVLNEAEKRVVAYHEAGHAVCGWYLKYADPLLKVSIIPRGRGALGYAQYLPPDIYLMSSQQLKDRMTMALGGRMSEVIHFPSVTSGASDDFKKVTNMATAMVTQLGMSPKVGYVNFETSDSEDLTKPFSEETASIIDEEVRGIIKECRERCLGLLKERLVEVGLVAEELLRKEVINREDMIRLLGKRPFPERNDAFDKYLEKRDGVAE